MKMGAFLKALFFTAILPIAAHGAQGEHQFNFKYNSTDRKMLKQIKQWEMRLEQDGDVYHNPQMDKYLTEVGSKLVPKDFFAPEVNFKFNVLRSPVVNAFALPDGTIFIHLGLLARMETEDQLAAVMDHEIAHATHGHVFLVNRGQQAAAVPVSIGILLGVGDLTSLVYVISGLGYSRSIEKEADLQGLSYFASSGYNIEQFPASLERLLVDPEFWYDPGNQNIFYLDHPKTEDRINYLKEAIKQNYPAPARGYNLDQAKKNYFEHTYLARLDSAKLDIKQRTFLSAKFVLEENLKFRPNDPITLTMLGNDYLEWYKVRVRQVEAEQKQKEQKKSAGTGSAEKKEGTPEKKDGTSQKPEEPSENTGGTAEKKETDSRSKQGEENPKQDDSDQKSARKPQKPERPPDPPPQELMAKAIEIGKKAQAVNPNMPEPYKLLGLAYFEKKEWANAGQAFRNFLMLSADVREKAIIRNLLEQTEKNLASGKEKKG